MPTVSSTSSTRLGSWEQRWPGESPNGACLYERCRLYWIETPFAPAHRFLFLQTHQRQTHSFVSPTHALDSALFCFFDVPTNCLRPPIHLSGSQTSPTDQIFFAGSLTSPLLVVLIACMPALLAHGLSMWPKSQRGGVTLALEDMFPSRFNDRSSIQRPNLVLPGVVTLGSHFFRVCSR